LRYLILSDLHANLPALEAVLIDARAVGYDQVVVLGDLVGYGADPEAVINRTIALDPVLLIRGNHDKVAAGLESSVLFNDVARVAIEWTRSVLPPRHVQFLAALPKGPCELVDGVTICHGATFDEDYYVLSPRDAERSAAGFAGTLCLFGHTHVPAVYAVTRARIDQERPEGDVGWRSGRRLINVGSVGQPRDADPRAAYGVLDTTTGRLTFRRVDYDIAEAQARIRRAGLPDWLGDRLELGR
jgi:diadenosine tetraphosphatase ApaH/serine/threonine PP2A family protein phosphatase